MDETPSLELGDLDKGETHEPRHLGSRHSCSGGEEPTHRNGRPAPQSPCVGVPEHGAFVVVVVGAERLTERAVVLAMSDVARERPTVEARRIGRSAARQMGAEQRVARGADAADASLAPIAAVSGTGNAREAVLAADRWAYIGARSLGGLGRIGNRRRTSPSG